MSRGFSTNSAQEESPLRMSLLEAGRRSLELAAIKAARGCEKCPDDSFSLSEDTCSRNFEPSPSASSRVADSDGGASTDLERIRTIEVDNAREDP